MNVFDPPEQLLLRETPQTGESLNGYLIRAAARNRWHGPSAILQRSLGRCTPPKVSEIEQLAVFCRCHPLEFEHLVGFWRHAGPDGRHWYLRGGWLTQSSFLDPRRSLFCPACLDEQGFAAGVWDIVLCTACLDHGCRLLAVCPNCRRQPSWRRSELFRCPCGQDFRRAIPEAANQTELWMASLLCSDVGRTKPPATDHAESLARLENLSLDAICKVVWLIGWLMPQLESRRVVRGRRTPTVIEARRMISEAYLTLCDWPHRYHTSLMQIGRRPPTHSNATWSDRVFSSIDRFLHAQDLELGFLVVAYERVVRELWHQRPDARISHRLDRQLEFAFD